MAKRINCREYFVADNEEIAKAMGMSIGGVEKLLRRASINFEKKLKERLGDSATLYDILPALSGRGDYNESLSSL